MQWKQIQGYSYYYVSNTGLVKSTKKYGGTSERLLKPYIDKYGYVTYHIVSDNGRKKVATAHRLLMKAFRPRSDAESLTVNHINGIKTENNLNNLEWSTVKENLQHSVNVLGNHMGEKNHRAKLTSAKAQLIRESYKPFVMTRKKLAALYGVDKSTIDRVLAGTNWNA